MRTRIARGARGRPAARALPARLLERGALLPGRGASADRGGHALKYLVAHDCGRELNPLIVEGMVHGSTVHGIGAALLEEFRYDAQGRLLTSTFLVT
jgi:hypothetical protein